MKQSKVRKTYNVNGKTIIVEMTEYYCGSHRWLWKQIFRLHDCDDSIAISETFSGRYYQRHYMPISKTDEIFYIK